MTGAVGFWLAAEGPSAFRALQRDASAVQELARKRLTHLLFHVARNNEFYGRLLQGAGIEWADPILWRDPYAALGALPPVSKLALRRARNRVLDRGVLRPEWYSSSSSGSTGEPFRVYYEPRSWALLKYLVKLRARRACGVRTSHRIALLDAIPPSPRSSSLARVSRWTRISILQPAESVAAALDAFAPDIIYGVPSALLDAGRILRQQARQLGVKAVFTSGELLQAPARRQLSAAFHARVYDIYGTSETKEIAWQCCAGNLHLNADVVHLEVVDDNGKGLPPGEEGDLVVTALVNRAMPLIRYRTGDRGTLLSHSCSCGCAMPLLGVATGRPADILVMRDGHRISPYALTCAIERIPGLLRYQVSQLDQARVRVRAILEAAADRSMVTAQVRSALRYDVAPFLDADVEFVDCLPSEPRAKFRVVEALPVAEPEVLA